MFSFEDIKNDLTERQKGLFNNGVPNYLRHYTQLPDLLKILESGLLKLGDSNNYNDQNDKSWANAYKSKAKTGLYSLCCTWETELIHHWKIYADGKYGCCLKLDGHKLIESVNYNEDIKHGLVCYKKDIPIDDIPDSVEKELLPFTKSWAYRCEYEYRFICAYESYINLDKDLIKQVSISPYMNRLTFSYFGDIIKDYKVDVSFKGLEKEN